MYGDAIMDNIYSYILSSRITHAISIRALRRFSPITIILSTEMRSHQPVADFICFM